MTQPVRAVKSGARQAPDRLVFQSVAPSRAVLLAAGAALLIVHLMWRWETTFAGLDTVGLTLSIGLFAVEAFIAVALVMTALAEILPAAVKIDPIALPEIDLPTVDVLILIADPKQTPKAAYSLAAAAQLDYPRDHVRLHLVGLERAADTDALESLASKTKASWLAASPEATSGNAINAALARTAGSLVLILNAGEAPTPDRLRRIAGGFDADPRLAFIDVPLFAIDGDPVLTDIDVTQRLPNDPGHFFKSCLKTIGAATGNLGLNQRTVWRRAALSASGSCSRWNMRPDAPARIRAAESGWRRGIATRPMVAAIAPDTVKEYLRQRLTQRIGTVDAALTRDPLLAQGLTLRERLSWTPALFAALLPFAWALAFAIPPLAVLLRIDIFGGVSMSEGALVSLAAAVTALALAGTLNAGMRDNLIAAWSEMLESLVSAPALARLVGRQEKTERAPDPEHANGLLVVLFAITLAGTTAGVAGWFMRPEYQHLLAAPLALTLFGACLFACLLGAIAEPRQRRLSPRMNRRIKAELLLGGERYAGRLADISVHGARFLAEEVVEMSARALAGKLTLTTPQGTTELPVQLSRQSEAGGRSAFGLSFTGRTVGEFATVVRLTHRNGDAYADMCDARAKPAGRIRLFVVSSWRGLAAFMRKISKPKTDGRWIPLRRMKHHH